MYQPVLWLLAISTAFAVGSIALSALVGPRRYNQVKLSSYECGIQTTTGFDGGQRIPIKYYSVAMTFLIFDIEIMFMLPWAVHFDSLGLFGFWAMMLFLVAISIVYVYEWKRGGLDWD